jgi:integrase
MEHAGDDGPPGTTRGPDNRPPAAAGGKDAPVTPRQRRPPARRGAGNGHIRKLPSGKWNGQIMLGYREQRTADGRVKLVRAVYSVTRERRREVEAELSRLRTSHDAGTLPAKARLTVGDLLDRWLREHVRQRRSAGTLKTYTSVVEAQLRPRLGHLPLTRLSPLRLVEEMNALGDQGYGRATVAKAWATLSGAFTWGARVRLLERNPLHGLEGPPKGEATSRALSPDEVARLRGAAREYRDGQWSPLVDLLAFTGLRLGEALGLLWGDVALPPEIEGPRKCGEVQVRVSKTRRGVRTVILTKTAVLALRLQASRQLAEEDWEAARREGWADALPVFPGPSGKPYSAAYFETEFGHLGRLSGVAGRVTPRDLRHTWSVTADRLKFGARARASFLGHTPQVNVASYTHEERSVMEQMARDVARELDGPAPPDLGPGERLQN